MVNENLGLVKQAVNQYFYYYIPQEDRFLSGVEGLLLAIDRFDVSKGFKFSTYAMTRIRERIQNERVSWNSVHVPRQIDHRYQSYLNGSTTHKLTEEEIEKAQSAYSKAVDISDKSANISDWLFGFDDTFNEKIELSILADRIKRLVKDHFNERDQTVLFRFYGFDGNGGYTEREISKQMGVSKGLVRHKIDKLYDIARRSFGLK